MPITPAAIRTKPRVLVLMATYNGAQWLGEQVESILAQEGVEVSLMAADDASRDKTRDHLEDLARRHPRVQLVGWDEGSGSAGANFRRLFRTVDTAGFDFVALADQDDVWHGRKLSAAIEALERSSSDGYSCAVRSFWPDGREKVLPQVAVPRGADFLFEGAGQGCTFVLRQPLFERAQDFCRSWGNVADQLHYHDWLLYLLARAWNRGWYFDQQAWIRYRQHGGNEIGSRGSLKSIARRVELIRNGWFGAQVGAAIAIFRTAKQDDGLVNRFAELFRQPDSLARRLKLLYFFVRHGRRRVADRIVLAGSAAAGWI
jgi:rhamnosyltransferase